MARASPAVQVSVIGAVGTVLVTVDAAMDGRLVAGLPPLYVGLLLAVVIGVKLYVILGVTVPAARKASSS